jgi:hypothetical protein
MDFASTLPKIIAHFEGANLRYALIGGLAMALRGVQRTTLDADFIILADDLETCHSILQALGYQRAFHTENVSHYLSADPALGRVDLLHAFRPATLGMLARAERLPLTPDCGIPVVHTEDLIGLKVQAACNDASRATGDWSDIHRLVENAARLNQNLDWELIGDYLDLFDQSHQLTILRNLHGETPSR